MLSSCSASLIKCPSALAVDGKLIQQEKELKEDGGGGKGGEGKKGGTKRGGGENKVEGEEGGEKDKVIFIHYEQRKVMLSQLHPIDNGVPDPQTESQLPQVRTWTHSLIYM